MTVKYLPRVAVLLAAFEGMQWIKEQIDSILNQQGVKVTLFVSVDSSTDGTDQWVQSLTNKNSNVFMLPYGERFGGAGPNFLRLLSDVDFSGFDAVSFADQDDIWFTDKLQNAYEILQTKRYDVYSSNVTAFWPDGRQEFIDKAQPQKNFDYLFEAAGPGCTYVFNPDSALAFKHFVLSIEGHFQGLPLHDWLAYAFCRSRGFKWFIDSRPSMLYRQHQYNQVGINKGLNAYRARFSRVICKSFRSDVEILLSLLGYPEGFQLTRSFLIRNFAQLRRRKRDAYVLLAFNLIGWY